MLELKKDPVQEQLLALAYKNGGAAEVDSSFLHAVNVGTPQAVMLI